MFYESKVNLSNCIFKNISSEDAINIIKGEFLISNSSFDTILNDAIDSDFSQGEMINRENLGKSLVAKTRLSKGVIVKASDISVKSPGQGLSPQYFSQLIGQKLTRDLEPEGFFFPTGHIL